MTGASAASEGDEVAASIQRYARDCPVIAARYAPVECWQAERLQPVPLASLRGARLLAFAGIASPAAFHATLTDDLGVVVKSVVWFADHHWYGERDVGALERRAAAESADGLVTTEKDWVRLRTLPFRRPLYVVSVQLDLLSGEAAWTAAFERACRGG
jgi:tetraacyldisaccharide-1-P 4'-kinase